MSRRVHDELGQIVTALDWEVAWLTDRLSTLPEAEYADVAEKLETMSELVGTLTQAVRTVAAELRPRVLDQFGLLAALEWQAREFEMRYRIPCKVSGHTSRHSIGANISTAIFRIFQETITNVARHALATEVRAHLEENASEVSLLVEDNGCGFAVRGLRESLGILGMRERAALLGGEIEITSVPGKGTTVITRIPQRRPATSGAGPNGDGLRTAIRRKRRDCACR
jgi:signal transduction histidine kinase